MGSGNYTFECILIHRIQPLPENVISTKLSESGRAIFVDIPSSAYKNCIEGAFWRLESPPQQLFIGHLSYQKQNNLYPINYTRYLNNKKIILLLQDIVFYFLFIFSS